MTDGETMTICGFGQPDQSICLSPAIASGKYCSTHDSLECAGCQKRPSHECDHSNDNGATYCRAPLCGNCEHRIAVGHGPKITVRDAAYEELAAALRISLMDAQAKGMVMVPEGREDALATKLLNDFSIHVTMKILSGIAQAPS